MLVEALPLLIPVLIDGDIGNYIAHPGQPIRCENDSGVLYRAVQCTGPEIRA